MAYDPKIHHRRSVRLRGYDYSSPGEYYVTICTHDKGYLFGHVADGHMCCNQYGNVAQEEWFRSAALRKDITLDAFTVMPNHIHGIIMRNVRARGALPEGRSSVGRYAPALEQFGKPVPGSLASWFALTNRR